MNMNTTRLIEAYLDGSLGKNIAKELKTRAENDFEFAELIRLHKEINDCIRDDELVSLRRTLAKMNGEYKPLNDRLMNPHRQIFRIAALFVLLLSLSIAVMKWIIPGYPGSAIFEKYYIKYEPDVVTRSDNIHKMDVLYAQFLYQTDNYSECVELLEDLVINGKENYMAFLYLGLVKIELDQTDDAIQSFLSIPPDWENPYSVHRNWYLALCFIKTGQTDQAIAILKGLSVPDGYYSKKAKKILRRIMF
jgi:hypothetical protein